VVARRDEVGGVEGEIGVGMGIEEDRRFVVGGNEGVLGNVGVGGIGKGGRSRWWGLVEEWIFESGRDL
ncbi:hypothetical protein, partial [Bacillus altitudinis]|uniref:hypothetical protein n=1 Tax=Bacillus altitudinis TaxID=293387 RepID=UPI003B51918B